MIVEEYCKGMDCYSSRAEYDLLQVPPRVANRRAIVSVSELTMCTGRRLGVFCAGYPQCCRRSEPSWTFTASAKTWLSPWFYVLTLMRRNIRTWGAGHYDKVGFSSTCAEPS